MQYAEVFVFFFQAEDGIRDYKVTGVQTCALPILHDEDVWMVQRRGVSGFGAEAAQAVLVAAQLRRQQLDRDWPIELRIRSEEGRGGEEGRSRLSPDHLKKKIKIRIQQWREQQQPV